MLGAVVCTANSQRAPPHAVGRGSSLPTPRSVGGTVASWCLVSRRPSARALLCRAASHWRCSSRGSSARSRCTGSHARSAWYLHRWGYSTPSGPGGWRPPPELGTVASWCLVSRHPSARALLCHAASHWRCSSSRGSSARSRCTVRARYREGVLAISFALEVAVLDARELRDTERGRELRRGRRLRRRPVHAFGWHPAKKASPWGLYPYSESGVSQTRTNSLSVSTGTQ